MVHERETPQRVNPAENIIFCGGLHVKLSRCSADPARRDARKSKQFDLFGREG